MPDPAGFRCPFCDRAAVRENEHVWAKWMGKSPAARQLVKGSHGRRIERTDAAVRLGDSGKYESCEGRPQRVAELLPHVQIDVCRSCNGGWMKGLEDRVKALLSPWSKVGWPVRLAPEDQTLLATWATKSWMAYTLLSGEMKNPFRTSEYRAISSLPQPLGRSRVWLIHSDAPSAYVGMGISSTLLDLDSPRPDMSTAPDNAGFAYLAFAEWVFFLVLAPHDNEVLDLLESDVPSIPTATRIWPPSEELVFPTATASSSDLSRLLAIPGDFDRALGLPVIGLTPQEIEEVREAFLAGVEPWQIRARWSPDELGKLERHRLQLDPEGYGRTPQPYKVLGGIAWHGGDYQLAVDHYQHARDLGASINMIGSQLCDALMFLGHYRDAALLSQQVMEEGPNEWRDLFRAEILHEIVEHLNVRQQARNADGRVNDQDALASPLEDLRSRLRDGDALDPLAWHGLTSRSPAENVRIGGIFADAYLSGSPASWLVLMSHAASSHSSEVEREAIREGLMDIPGLIDICQKILDELVESEDLEQAYHFLEMARARSVTELS